MTLKEALAMYQARQDETGRIHLQCLCDGTLGFMSEMVALLRDCLHCKDIEMSDEIITEGISKDKPWCNCLMKASGMPTTGARTVRANEHIASADRNT